MTKTRTALLGLAAVASVLSLTAAAQAQGPGAPARPALQQGADDMRADREQRQARRAQTMHDILGVTPAQEGAWNAFQAAMKPPAGPDGRGPGGRGPGPEDMANLTTPQRLDKRLEGANRRHAEELARINATRAFYAQLSPTQKKAFDALPPMGGGERGGQGGRMGRRGGPDGGPMGPGGRGARGGFGQGGQRGGPGGPPPQ